MGDVVGEVPWALGQELCSWAKHFMLKMPLSTQKYEWVLTCSQGSLMKGRRNLANSKQLFISRKIIIAAKSVYWLIVLFLRLESMFSLPGMLRVVINEDFVFVVVVFFSVRREKQCNVTCSKISLSSSWEKVGCYANVISLLIVLSCLYSVHWPALCVGFSFEGGGGAWLK